MLCYNLHEMKSRYKTKRKKSQKVRLPKEFKKYFWDVDFNKISLKKQLGFVLSRVLNFGNMRAIRWMLKTTSEQAIKNFIITRGGRQLDKRSNNFWKLFFGLS